MSTRTSAQTERYAKPHSTEFHVPARRRLPKLPQIETGNSQMFRVSAIRGHGFGPKAVPENFQVAASPRPARGLRHPDPRLPRKDCFCWGVSVRGFALPSLRMRVGCRISGRQKSLLRCFE